MTDHEIQHLARFLSMIALVAIRGFSSGNAEDIVDRAWIRSRRSKDDSLPPQGGPHNG